MKDKRAPALVTAWNNGAHHGSGAGYGLKLDPSDRDRLFRREWRNVILELAGVPTPIVVNIAKPSFWGTACRELIKQEIGQWLRANNLAPWPKGNPPRLALQWLAGNRFRLSRNKPNA